MSEYQQDGLARLEQKCVAPGHWVIEGHTVLRLNSWWWRITCTCVGADHSGGRAFRTLRECRELIYELVHDTH